MKKFLFILLVVLVSPLLSNAQTLPSTVQVSQPKVLLASVIKQTEVYNISESNDWGQNNTSQKYWTVYSDRDNNTLYSSPNGSSVGELNFNEKVRIAKINGKWALVYNEPKEGISYPNISAEAGNKKKGWVQMSKLLLWNTCPADEKGIYHKALIVVNLDDVRNKNDIGKIYKNPDTRSNPGRLMSDMNFYFVMKEQGDLVLLARQYKMEGITDQVLYGWVSKTSYIPWNQRSCLEPNWDQSVVDNSLKGQNVYVYTDSHYSKTSAHYTYGKSNGDSDPTSKYRMPRMALRFPILDNDVDNKDIYKCTTFGNGGNLGNAMLLQEQRNSAQDKALKALSQLNIIFAIDGTKSMKPYFESVKEAIQKGTSYFGQQYTVKFGVVIYRDYADGDGLVETLPLCNPKDPRLAAFLDSGGNYGVQSSPADHTHTEALYKGLEVATDPSKMGFKKRESNLVLVVGDCGNALNDTKSLSKETLIKRISDYDIQLMSFQVRRNNSEPWLLFNDQMTDIIKGNVDNQYAVINVDGKVKPKFKQSVDGYDLKTSLRKQFFTGALRFAPVDVDMEPSKLSSLIQSIFTTFQECINAQGETIADTNPFEANVDSEKDNLEAQVDSAFIISRLGQKYYEYVKQSNTMVAFNGYVMKKDNAGNDYWKPVIYISSDEFNALLTRLEPVNRVAIRRSDERKPYVDAIKALIRSMIPDITDAEMDMKSTQEVMALISGLNASTSTLNGPSLIQIQDPKAVTPEQFMSMVNDFTRKYKNLTKIKGAGYKYSLEVNNTRYYWIPVEDLP